MARRGVGAALKPAAVAGILSLFALSSASAADQSLLRFRVGGEYSLPVLGDEAWFSSGYEASASLEYAMSPYLSPIARAAYASLSLKNLSPVALYEGALGVSSRFDFIERVFARLEASGGLYRAIWGDYNLNGLAANARAEIGIRLSPAFRLAANIGLTRFFQGSSSLYTGASAGLNLSIFPEGFDPTSTKMRIDGIDLFPVFPVFYSYYDDHALGHVQLRNGEDVLIRDVRVSFYSPEYMAKPTECAVFETIAKGQSVRVPMTALFNEKILSLTERTKTRAELIVQYRMLGSKREFRHEIDLSVYHRNAMTWSDDRHAAAFVSSKDPAVLWFSRFVNAVVRDRFRVGIDKNLQQAVGIFEAMKLFGLAYVVDPSSAYAESAGSDDTIDYLQYPYQTLFYRGGDCDDLSILFSSLLESVGIETAFITIPGHIYMAFSAAMNEQEARKNFYDPDLLIFRNGKVWIPVEITMVKDGFVKAWRVGAKEWVDNDRQKKANFYPMAESWKTFPPVGIPDINPRFQLPDEAVTMKAFDLALDRHVAREIEPRLKALKARMALSPSPETENEIALVYARAGMLNEAWTHFSIAAQKGYIPAWTNLANVAFIRKDFTLARDYYRYALDRSEYDPPAALGIARSEYELERFGEAETAYEDLKELDAPLASKYSYLASVFGGKGRAWSLAERAETVEWADRVLSRPAAEPVKIAAAPVRSPAPVAPVPKPVETAPAAKPVETPPAPAVAAPADKPAEPVQAVAAPVLNAPAAVVPAEKPAEPVQAVAAPVLNAPAIAVPAEKPAEPAPAVAAPVLNAPAIAAPAEKPAEPTPAVAAPVMKTPVPAAPAPVIAAAAPVDADLKEKERESAALKAEAPAAAAAIPPETPVPTRRAQTQKNASKPLAPSIAPKISAAAPVDLDLKEREAESARTKQVEVPAPVKIPPVSVAAAPKPAPAEKPIIPPSQQRAQTPPVEAPVSPPLPATPIEAAPKSAPEKAVQPSVSIAAEPATKAEKAPVVEQRKSAERAMPVEQPKPVLRSEPVEAPAERPASIAKKTESFPPVAPSAQPSAPDANDFARFLALASFNKAPPLAEKPAALLEGFASFRIGPGAWKLSGDTAVQSDPLQMYAKIAASLPTKEDRLRVSFNATATGYRWTGFGVHLMGSGVKTLKGYGAGESYLVWFTADPANFPDAPNRVQVYRSIGDSDMLQILDKPLIVSIREKHAYVIEGDAVSGEIRVMIDGDECLRALMAKFVLSGPQVIFRALDTVEFADFRAEAIPSHEERN